MKISINHDFDLDIATAHSRLSKKWQNKTWKWSDILELCAEPKRTAETVAEYRRMSREEQSGIKDVGGFVAGYLRGGVRKAANALYRTAVTLDLDYATGDVWDDFTMNFGCAALLYSTHSHTHDKPRLRLVLPASRQMTPAEYEPVCRYWTSRIGIELFDQTTYDLNRLMYWPSVSKDGEYIFEFQDGEAFDVDAVLQTYKDPFDASQWPLSSRERGAVTHEIKKAGDPTDKPGLIGAFCRTYTIEDAIEKFLPDVYEKTAVDGRYTYRAGSVAGGLVTYEDKFAYSHHDTDPASKQLCNAFDLVRIHLFGAQDEGSQATDITRLPSYTAMQNFVSTDKEVRILMARERLDEAATDFAGIEVTEESDAAAAEVEDNDDEWLGRLETDKHGIKSTINNIAIIIDNDRRLKGHIYLDLMRNNIFVEGGLPWDAGAHCWGNRDDANLRGWLEKFYNVFGKDRVKDALDMVITKHRRHPIREYFKSLVWDGTLRLEHLIIDYLGAEDTDLNRRITRIHFTAAVARVMQPGCKYDYCLILAGPQGVGKSTLISIMGGDFYKDGLTSMEGKEGGEQVQGCHLIEIGELDGMKRSEVTTVKQFITACYDEFRPAYGVRKERVPRQCVFFGTTNEQFFLKDDTGNRRFPVITIKPDLRKHGDDWFGELRELRDQLWAEAVEYWRRGEKLYLSRDMEREAEKTQADYADDDSDMEGELRAYLDTRLPADWDAMGAKERRAYIATPDPLQAKGVVRRDNVCPLEFISERLGGSSRDKDYKYLSFRVVKLLRRIGWEGPVISRHAEAVYGRQKSYKRPEITTEDEDEI